MSSLPPAGWYDDPQNPAKKRWWDGTTWTDVAENAEPPPPPAAQPQGAHAPQTAEPLFAEPGPPPQPQAPFNNWNRGLNEAVHEAKDFYQQHKTGVDLAAGTAMAADGLIGNPLTHRGGIGGAIGAVLVGAIFAIFGLVFANMTAIPTQLSASTMGHVTNMNWSTVTSHGNTSLSCNPQVSYQVGGKIYSTSQGFSSSPCPVTMGQLVAVRYDPSDPANGRIPASGLMKWIPWLFILVGIFAVLAGIFQFIKSVLLIGAGGFFLVKAERDHLQSRKQSAEDPPPA